MAVGPIGFAWMDMRRLFGIGDRTLWSAADRALFYWIPKWIPKALTN